MEAHNAGEHDYVPLTAQERTVIREALRVAMDIDRRVSELLDAPPRFKPSERETLLELIDRLSP